MLDDKKLARINSLAKLSKKRALTLKEQKEQKELRQEYLNSIKSSFKNQITNLTVIDPEGNDVTPEKVRKLKKNKKK